MNNTCLVYKRHIGVCDGSQHVEKRRTRKYTLKTCIHIAVDLSSVGEAFVKLLEHSSIEVNILGQPHSQIFSFPN